MERVGPMLQTVPAEARQSPRVASPRRPGLGSLAWSILRPARLSATSRRPWIAWSTASAHSLFLAALTYFMAFGSSGQISKPPI